MVRKAWLQLVGQVKGATPDGQGVHVVYDGVGKAAPHPESEP